MKESRIRLLIIILIVGMIGFLLLKQEKPHPEQLPLLDTKKVSESTVPKTASTYNRPEALPIYGKSSAEMSAYLMKMPSEEAVEIIKTALTVTEDWSTGDDFKVGGGNQILSTEHAHAMLLELLNKLSPDDATQVALLILKQANNPDEFAVALKVATKAGETPIVEQAMDWLLYESDWLKDPAVATLEAFDTFVYLEDPKYVQELASMMEQKENKAIANASFIALERLVLKAPEETLGLLLESPSLMDEREASRATFFSRLDVREVEQKALVEDYMQSLQAGTQEHDLFFSLYPNFNYIISNNLITTTDTPDETAIRAFDVAALDHVNRLLSDPQFSQYHGKLKQVKQRLEIYYSK